MLEDTSYLVDVNNSGLTDDGGVELIGRLRRDARVRDLNLSGNRLGPLICHALAQALAANELRLTNLDFSHNRQIGGDDIAAILRTHKLKRLALRGCPKIGRELDVVTEELAKDRSLVSLNLNDCDIRDAQMKKLCAVVPICGLLELHVMSNLHGKNGSRELETLLK
jgi:hypothetical protein